MKIYLVRKKPIYVQAIKHNEYLKDEEVKKFLGERYCGSIDRFKGITIKTLEGDHLSRVGDYIIKGIKNECYPIKPDIFERSYDIIRFNEDGKEFNIREENDSGLKIL